MRKRMYRLVEVVWVDAEEYGEIGWNDIRSMKRYAKKPCPEIRSVGYVLYQNETHISLASSVGDKECSSLEKIPSEFVKSIKVLVPGEPTGKSEEMSDAKL